MIEIQNLYKSYGSLEVLKDISFKIEKGDIFVVRPGESIPVDGYDLSKL